MRIFTLGFQTILRDNTIFTSKNHTYFNIGMDFFIILFFPPYLEIIIFSSCGCHMYVKYP